MTTTTPTTTDNGTGRDKGSEEEEDSPLPAPSVLVLACGYRQVYIPKSGLSFPAWLIYVRGNNGSSRRCVWRSKRHFWRLARQMDRLLLSSSAAPQQQPFPKAAWNKLCDAAPWKRPDFEAHVSTMLPKEASSDAHYYDPRALLEAENQWQPKMIKGLLQLDQYLQRVAALEEAHDAWHEFVQAPFDGNNDDPNHNQQHDDNVEAARVGNALGQYFCDPRNARQVVQTALHRLELLHNGSPASSRSLLFVEPSCGYGQIIETLLQVLHQSTASNDEAAINNKNGNDNDSFHIRGIDVDAVAIATCQEKFRSHANVSLTCCNFLETSVGDKEHKTVIVVGGPPYTAGAGKASDDHESSLGRDLPMQFVRHAIQAHAAAVICLLMPARCESVDYVADGWIPSFSSSSCRYEYETIPLQAPSLFYFQGGGEPVKQPSVIQCFWRVDV